MSGVDPPEKLGAEVDGEAALFHLDDPDTLSAELKREVWTRAGGRCEFILASGERCGCTRRLEFDHVDPVALGGRALSADDVRLCCRDHNQLAARRVFGDAVMDRYARGGAATTRDRPFVAAQRAGSLSPREAKRSGGRGPG